MRGAIALRAFVAGLLLLLGAGSLRPAFAGQLVSGRVVCSTITTSPTLVSAGSQFYRDLKLVNASTNYVLIGDSSTSFSTSASTGTARLVTPTATAPRELDLGDFPGPVYCVGSVADGVTNVIDFWRIK